VGMLKVCLVDPSLFTSPYDRALAGGLSGIHDKVSLYCCRDGQDRALRESCEVVQHFYLPLSRAPFVGLPRSLLRPLKGVYHPSSMWRLVGELKERQPDVIHFQWTPFPLVDRWFLPALRRIAPAVLTVHDAVPFNGSPSSRIQEIGAASILERFDGIIVHTDQARSRLENLGSRMKTKICKIPHGLLHEGTTAQQTARQEGPSDPIVNVLLFGKVKPYKGVDVLIRALALLPLEIQRKSRVKVVGEAYMDTRKLIDLAGALGVNELIQFDFRFVGDDEIATVFGAASIAVLPYRQIDASGVLMTAVAAGLPIIATNIGGFAEILEDGRNALLVPPNNDRALAEALVRVIDDAALRERLAAGSRELRSATPSWREIGRLTHALYEEVIGKE
jgi:glycosyltransferase involved in cell wall biosynthesis